MSTQPSTNDDVTAVNVDANVDVVVDANAAAHPPRIHPVVSTVAAELDGDDTERLYQLCEWSEWSRVDESSVAEMTYAGYVATAAASLPPSIRRRFGHCRTPDKVDHADPWPVVYNNTDRPYDLHRRIDRATGRAEYKVVANRRIDECSVIGFLAGQVVTEEDAKQTPLTPDNHIRIERGYLQTYYGYEGDDAIVLLLDKHRNILSNIRDPATIIQTHHDTTAQQQQQQPHQRLPDILQYNIHIEVAIDEQSRLPFVILWAWLNIQAGEELTAFLSLGLWYSSDHKRLFIAARNSHWYHRNVTALEAVLSERQVNFDGAVTGNVKAQPLSVIREWELLGDENDRQNVLSDATTDAMKRIAEYDAFPLCNCVCIKKAFIGSSLSSHTKAILQTLPDFIPKSIELDEHIFHDIDPAIVRHVVNNGHDPADVEVVQVNGLTSPVRYYSPPWHPAFAVVAKRPLPAGTLLFTYAGQIEQHIQNEGSVYVYDVRPDHVQLYHPDYPKTMPDLIIDAEKYGNIARFVNDHRYRRRSEGEDEFTAVNIGHTYVVIDHLPHIIFYTTKAVKKHDELISSYGDDFWRDCMGQMLKAHAKYYDYISEYSKKLVHLARTRRIPLPLKPDVFLEKNPIFSKKTILYSCERNPTEHFVDNNDEWEVEDVMGRCMMYSIPHFHVKWKGFDESYNSWEPITNLAGCEEMIKRFERQNAVDKRRAKPAKRQSALLKSDGSGPRKRTKASNIDTTKAAESNSESKEQSTPRASSPTSMPSASSSSSSLSNASNDDVTMIDNPHTDLSVPTVRTSPLSQSPSTVDGGDVQDLSKDAEKEVILIDTDDEMISSDDDDERILPQGRHMQRKAGPRRHKQDEIK